MVAVTVRTVTVPSLAISFGEKVAGSKPTFSPTRLRPEIQSSTSATEMTEWAWSMIETWTGVSGWAMRRRIVESAKITAPRPAAIAARCPKVATSMRRVVRPAPEGTSVVIDVVMDVMDIVPWFSSAGPAVTQQKLPAAVKRLSTNIEWDGDVMCVVLGLCTARLFPFFGERVGFLERRRS